MKKKKAGSRKGTKSRKAKQGDRLVCDTCGEEVMIVQACDCDECSPNCCGEEMRVVSCR